MHESQSLRVDAASTAIERGSEAIALAHSSQAKGPHTTVSPLGPGAISRMELLFAAERYQILEAPEFAARCRDLAADRSIADPMDGYRGGLL